MFKRMFMGLLLVFLVGHSVLAHETWIEKRDGQILVLRGHGGKTEPYDTALVKEAKATDAKGLAVAIDVKENKENASLVPEGSPAVIGALYDSGYWLKTTDGWKKATKREGKGKYDIVEALKSKQYCKNVLIPCGASTKALGQRFEVVPEVDPLTVKVGDKLPVIVVLDGKPVEAAIVETGGDHESKAQEPLKTDKDGIAKVTIDKTGLQMVKASIKVPIKDDADADLLSFSSTLTFESK